MLKLEVCHNNPFLFLQCTGGEAADVRFALYGRSVVFFCSDGVAVVVAAAAVVGCSKLH